jgi:hypothetical protein
MNRKDLAYLSRRIRLKFGLRFTPREDLICSRLAQSYLIAGRYKRIYHYHNHKTGGTSINQMFLGTSCVSGKRIHEKLRRSRNFRVLEKQKIFVGWNRRLIEQGNYFYAYSHIPAHQIRLPAHTFTITCIRDPVRRLLSYYNMLLDYREADYYRPNMEKQLKWLGSDFTDFIDNVPRSYRQRQLYMFSETYELQEALDRILNCSYLLFTDSLAEDVADLGQILGLDLYIGHARKSSRDGSLSPDEKRLAEIVLEPELRLFEELRRLRSVQE